MTNSSSSPQVSILKDSLNDFAPPPLAEICGNGYDPSLFDSANLGTWPRQAFSVQTFERDDTVTAVVTSNDGNGTIYLEPVLVFQADGKTFTIRNGKFDFVLNNSYLIPADLNALTPGTVVWVWVEDLNPDDVDYWDFIPRNLMYFQRVRLAWAMVDASLQRLQEAYETGEVLTARAISWKLTKNNYPAATCLNCGKTIKLQELKDNEFDFNQSQNLADWQAWLDFYNFKCPLCKKQAGFEDPRTEVYPDGGVTVAIGATTGFLHRSRMAYERGLRASLSFEEVEQVLKEMVGQEIQVTVGKIDVQERQLFLNERQAVKITRRQQAGKLWPALQVGQRYQAIVTNMDGPNTFVRIEDCIEGIVPARFLQHGWTFNPAQVVKAGDTFEVKVISVDKDRQRIAFSRRHCLPNPWETADLRFSVGQMVTGTMTNQTQTGAIFVQIEPGISGIIHPDDSPSLKFEIGREIPVEIVSINFARRRMQLSHRQAMQKSIQNDLTEGTTDQGVIFDDLAEPEPIVFSDLAAN